MSHTHDFFTTGFLTTWSGRFFNCYELLRHFKNFDHPTLQPKIKAELSFIEKLEDKAKLETVRVQSFAGELGIVMMPLPDFPEAYFSWSRMCLSGFESRRNRKDYDQVAFEIGYHAGTVLAASKLLSIILNLSAAVPGVPAFEQQWKHANKTIEQGIKKLKPAKQMALLIPKGPVTLANEFAEEVVTLAEETLQADVDCANEAYLLLLSSKIKHQTMELKEKATALAATNGPGAALE